MGRLVSLFYGNYRSYPSYIKQSSYHFSDYLLSISVLFKERLHSLHPVSFLGLHRCPLNYYVFCSLQGLYYVAPQEEGSYQRLARGKLFASGTKRAN